jgi:hypothetical protein
VEKLLKIKQFAQSKEQVVMANFKMVRYEGAQLKDMNFIVELSLNQ